jgi:hypothetical protein
LEDGTDKLVSNYKNVTPGEEKTWHYCQELL